MFRALLKTEFSDENNEFWLTCKDYKKIKSPVKLVSKANKIYKEFIDVQAPREVCEENIAFYLACEDYRNTKCIAKLSAKAQRIYNEFIGREAPREVNIDHETRDITQINVKSPTPKCFDLAQYRIYILMEKDCYPRFLRSTTYRDLLSQLTKMSSKAGK
ncbi:hypothetical protein P4O66_001217 [Electrophorus voltai]|uniref:RGS domain-containing protein n=1 Tax=Electrophorus voltai TaxID=2609070 RepID=A0AAD8Z9U6_9TELE|nr:hypothetical protein P4O66_001217 [Electrophorus voltai]